MFSFDFGATLTRAVYRALWQMKKVAMVISEPSERRLSRRSYSITEVGEAYLEFWVHSLERYWGETDLFLRLYNRRAAL